MFRVRRNHNDKNKNKNIDNNNNNNDDDDDDDNHKSVYRSCTRTIHCPTTSRILGRAKEASYARGSGDK